MLAGKQVTDFGRMITAMVTPMAPDGKVDYTGAAKLALHLVEQGSEGLVISGTTGEASTLNNQEKLDLFRTVVETVKGKAKVIAGTGDNETATSAELTALATETGVDGVLAVTPYYNKPTQEGIYQHFKHIAAATHLPVMLYNIPSRTSVNMTAETTLRLAHDIPNVACVKECADLGHFAHIVENAPAGFRVYSGDDGVTLPALAVGGYGIVSVASHVVGPQMRAMIDAFLAGRVVEAAALHRKLLPLFGALFAVTNPILVKAALEELGFAAGPLRLPMVSASEKERAALRAALQAAGVMH